MTKAQDRSWNHALKRIDRRVRFIFIQTIIDSMKIDALIDEVRSGGGGNAAQLDALAAALDARANALKAVVDANAPQT